MGQEARRAWRLVCPPAAITHQPHCPPPTDADHADLFSSLGSQLKQLGSKLQHAAQSAGPTALELTPFKLAGSTAAAPQPAAPGSSDAGGGAGSKGAMLESDPDLEAYLQVAISDAQGGEGGEHAGASGGGGDAGEGAEEAEEDDDLDLDSYLNELTAEVDAADSAAAAAAEEATAAG